MQNEFNFLIYRSAEENVAVNAVIKDDTIWLTQRAMSELFSVEIPAISKHLSNIYAEGELNASTTVSKMEIVQQEGVRRVKRNVDFYNLDAIISVGYRVNSRRATQFRIWATGVLKEYMIKGFAMDDERLKQGKAVLARITSENCWSVSALSGPVSGVFGSKSPISSQNVASTTTGIPPLPEASTPWCKTSFIMP